jgi:hypothetical protein
MFKNISKSGKIAFFLYVAIAFLASFFHVFASTPYTTFSAFLISGLLLFVVVVLAHLVVMSPYILLLAFFLLTKKEVPEEDIPGWLNAILLTASALLFLYFMNHFSPAYRAILSYIS